MNPSAILKLMSAKAAFTKNHPKFSAFCKAALSRPIEPGTIIEISLQRPGEEPMMANIKVQQEDLDLLESLKGLSEYSWKSAEKGEQTMGKGCAEGCIDPSEQKKLAQKMPMFYYN